jgi:hypothetical protein
LLEAVVVVMVGMVVVVALVDTLLAAAYQLPRKPTL